MKSTIPRNGADRRLRAPLQSEKASRALEPFGREVEVRYPGPHTLSAMVTSSSLPPEPHQPKRLRDYPANSGHAAARLVEATMIADGRIDATELGPWKPWDPGAGGAGT